MSNAIAAASKALTNLPTRAESFGWAVAGVLVGAAVLLAVAS